MSDLLLLVVLSAAVYRVGRFFVLDTLIDEPRDWVMGWLERKPGIFWLKLHELLGCPWCITIWVAAAVVAGTDLAGVSVPLPLWMWLATATGGLVFWTAIDSE